MSRAIRRHHRFRLMRKRKYYHWYRGDQIRWGEPERGRIAFHVNTPCPCSCDGCGNPRRSLMAWSDRLTMQERRFEAEEE